MEKFERCFRSHQICSGWSLTKNRCTKVGYILTTPDYVDEKKVKSMLSDVPGYIGYMIIAEIYQGKEFYFSSTLGDKELLSWVVNTFRLEHTARVRKKKETRKVGQYTLDGKLVKVWESCNEIVKETGWSQSHICNAIAGRVAKAHDYVWKYLDDEVE